MPMRKKVTYSIIFFAFNALVFDGYTAEVVQNQSPGDCFKPGQVWLDTQGKVIQAHSAGILYKDGVYYWYGENKDGPTKPLKWTARVDVIGVGFELV